MFLKSVSPVMRFFYAVVFFTMVVGTLIIVGIPVGDGIRYDIVNDEYIYPASICIPYTLVTADSVQGFEDGVVMSGCIERANYLVRPTPPK